jgi:phenylacetate-CoA ligase
MYSAEEMGYMALQCPEHEHYHVQSENVLLEVLRDDGAPCGPGETGRVVVTPLHNFAMPLFRYANGDHAEVGPPCPCGRGLPVLSRIMGRSRNMLRLPDGSSHWPSFPSETWIDIAPIRRLQLVQHGLQAIEARIVAERDLDADEEVRLVAALRGTLGYPFDISVTRVEAIGRSGNYKFEDFICRIPS